MSQGVERQNKAEWRSPLAWVRGSEATLAEAARAQVEEPDSAAAANEWLRAAPRHLTSLAGAQLIDAVARIDDALPLLMACAALDPAPAAELVIALLDGMVRAGQGEASARAVAILARRRA